MVAEAVGAADGAAAPFMTTEDSLSVMRVVYAGYRASETGMVQKVV